jgi:argininosuccinate lyase
LLDLAAALNDLRGTLLDLAAGLAVSVMPVMIDGAVAQPSTIGQWLGGLIGPLSRAGGALESAYSVVNESPLGVGSHAASGLENDRVATAEALGFAAPIQSGFDAVASVDHFTAAANVAASVGAALGRWLNELALLIRTEPASLRLAESWTGDLADMPQFDAPMGVEKLSAQSEALVERASGIAMLGMRAAYAPAAARLSGLLDLTTSVIEGARNITTETRRLIAEDLEFNRAYLANRAGRAFSTASDLADFLMIEEQQDPRAAQAIAALTISRAREQGIEASGITPELIDGAALLAIGQELKVEFEAISRYLAPRRFIERRTAIGGASPAATRAYIEYERTKLEADIAWRMDAVKAIEEVASEA